MDNKDRLGSLLRAEEIRLYYHANCFDGAVSAAFLLRFLALHHYPSKRIQLRPVSYGGHENWLDRELGESSLVVDFLFHLDAAGWWDHHETAFLTPEAEEVYRQHRSRDLFCWEPEAPSCAELLRQHFAERFSYSCPRMDEAVEWANIIDAARYESPHQRIQANEPAIQIDLSFGQPGYNNWVVRRLSQNSLKEVATAKEVQERFVKRHQLMQKGIEMMKASLEIEDGIVWFDVSENGASYDRYLPYYFVPEALFSVGLIHYDKGLLLLTMRNPWREVDFPYPSLGKLCERFGGGGHQRVGAVKFPAEQESVAQGALKSIVSTLKESACGKEIRRPCHTSI